MLAGQVGYTRVSSFDDLKTRYSGNAIVPETSSKSITEDRYLYIGNQTLIFARGPQSWTKYRADRSSC
jgi:hypothetical protein